MELELEAHTRLGFNVRLPTWMLMVLRPAQDHRQQIQRDEFHVRPEIPVREYTDGFGNRCQRLEAPTGHFLIDSRVRARVSSDPTPGPEAGFVNIAELPDRVLPFLLPSRYCESDRAGQLAREVVGNARPGQQQVERICDWVLSRVQYRIGSGERLLSALEVLERGEGVCRDLSHLVITLCRALSMPARFVTGYVENLQPMDLHAWLEVWLEGGWRIFDPMPVRPGPGRLFLACGRDAADVPLFNQFGPELRPEIFEVTVARP